MTFTFKINTTIDNKVFNFSELSNNSEIIDESNYTAANETLVYTPSITL